MQKDFLLFKAAGLMVVLALAGCSGSLPRYNDGSPCATNPGGHECEIQRYMQTRKPDACANDTLVSCEVAASRRSARPDGNVRRNQTGAEFT